MSAESKTTSQETTKSPIVGTELIRIATSGANWKTTVDAMLADRVFATNNTFSGTNNFTGAFQKSGTAQTFPASGLLVGTTDTQTLTNKSISGSQINSGTIGVTVGGTGTSTQFTAGSVVFAGTSGVYSQDNANLFWDDSNNRLGIGTVSPSRIFNIRGDTVLNLARNQARITSYNPAWSLLNNAGTSDAYFGINEASANEIEISGGTSFATTTAPSITIDNSNGQQVNIGKRTFRTLQASFNVMSESTWANQDNIATFLRNDDNNSGAGVYFNLAQFSGNHSAQVLYKGYAARGTVAAPTAIQTSDIVLGAEAHGYNGSAFRTTGSIQILGMATENWSGSANGSKWVFYTTPNGSTTEGLALTIDQDKSLKPVGGIQTPQGIAAKNATATPAAAGAVAALTMGSANVSLFWATGSPDTVVSAAKGSLYIRTDGSSTSTRIYVNTDGATAWTNITTAA